MKRLFLILALIFSISLSYAVIHNDSVLVAISKSDTSKIVEFNPKKFYIFFIQGEKNSIKGKYKVVSADSILIYEKSLFSRRHILKQVSLNNIVAVYYKPKLIGLKVIFIILGLASFATLLLAPFLLLVIFILYRLLYWLEIKRKARFYYFGKWRFKVLEKSVK